MTFLKSPQEARQIWIEALRNGIYQQGEGVLHSRDNKFCCLGVACDIFRNIEGENFLKIEERKDGFCYLYGGDDALLPQIVMKWLGLKGRLGSFKEGEKENYLSILNDNQIPFKKIASIIENEDSLWVEE